ncbi:ABC transporter C family member 13-like [Cryptomeria japonica]|uniref:ABC transporter C family member 13-like n=1 Tax=Cryptomeria japonica TaxID=3369 RepID=UPI0027D9E701|nr:ABC transporter C family member 13-like [Cryptomeria japonica]
MNIFRAIIGARKVENFTFICPTVWDGYDFSPCFENVFFGFGANIFTLFLFLLSVVIKQKQVQQRSFHTYKIKWLSVIPCFGISFSFVDISMHFTTILQGGHFDYHEWLFQSSQLVTWVATLFIMIYDSWYILTQNWALCVWWFVKPLLDFPRLRTHCSSSEGWSSTCFKETCSVSIEITFGLMILILWIKNLSGISVSRESHFLKDRLIVCDGEENSKFNSHDTSISSIWNSLTFRWVSPLMDLGLKKQINFDDLFQLPHELDPLACHDALKKCWTDEERKSADQPSLFRAIYHTYGWPYLWIGILKVLILSFFSVLFNPYPMGSFAVIIQQQYNLCAHY